jgi:hypothetical protein
MQRISADNLVSELSKSEAVSLKEGAFAQKKDNTTYRYCERGLRRRIAYAQCQIPVVGYKPTVPFGGIYETSTSSS